jgi:hypothetical protein
MTYDSSQKKHSGCLVLTSLIVVLCKTYDSCSRTHRTQRVKYSVLRLSGGNKHIIGQALALDRPQRVAAARSASQHELSVPKGLGLCKFRNKWQRCTALRHGEHLQDRYEDMIEYTNGQEKLASASAEPFYRRSLRLSIHRGLEGSAQ